MSDAIQIRYANDGHTFGDWRDLDTGQTGSFLKELVCRRLGITRHRVWEFRDVSDTAADVIAVQIEADGG